MDEYIVYVRTDSGGIITDINSSAFISGVGWTEIDCGEGDKYHHAQGNYLELPIMDNDGIYNYKYQDNQVVLRTKEDKNPEYIKIQATQTIAELKRYLADTDYIAAKLAEGVATKEEYADELAKRANARTRINELKLI